MINSGQLRRALSYVLAGALVLLGTACSFTADELRRAPRNFVPAHCTTGVAGLIPDADEVEKRLRRLNDDPDAREKQSAILREVLEREGVAAILAQVARCVEPSFAQKR